MIPPGASFLVVGLGITGRAMVRAAHRRRHAVVATDDGLGGEAAATAAGELDVPVLGAPTSAELRAAVARADVLLPSPGIPDHHPVFAAAQELGVPVASEFDLAAAWDDRPLLAVTGTNGKTTVCDLTTAMLRASGREAAAVGNTETPLVAAIDDPTYDLFVVEASSFRLGHTQRLVARVATWLNFAPDHLDNHRDLAAYEAAKASIWADDGTGLAVANADDPVVLRNTNPQVPLVTFGGPGADYACTEGALLLPGGEPLIEVADLWRAHPHDQLNSLAAAATALGGGASLDGVRETLGSFRAGAHRIEELGSANGVRWVDDSKSTSPHSTLAAVRAFPRVVLLAGGRNKGLDLSPMAAASDHLRAVVAIGDASDEVAAVFDGLVPVVRATSMAEAVHHAAALARQGDAVLLSPGCASFDWYTSYHARGVAFAEAVAEIVGVGR